MVKIKIEQNLQELITKDIKITLMGKFGAGKSTLLGVLITGEEDDGEGSVRMLMMKHKHEIE